MKILIFTASTGGGHKRAAAAMKEYFELAGKNNEVKVVDGIAQTGKFYNKFICGGYTVLAKKMPRFYGRLYRSSDRESALNNFCERLNRSKGKHILPVINEFDPDIIVCCHAFITIMLGDLKLKGLIKAPVVSVITDFQAHYTYVADGIDHYIVSTDDMVRDMSERHGVDPSKVHAYGIPVFRKFLMTPDRGELCSELGLDPDKKTILFMAGSFGVNEVLDVYKDIVSKAGDSQFVVITGNNAHLYKRFGAIAGDNTKLLMFVNNVEDYMHCSDLIITKPGGLTVSESLQCRLPMAIYSAFPGQEADNAEYLAGEGVAVMLGKNPGAEVYRVICDDDRLAAMSENCKKTLSGNSCEKIYNLLETLTTQKG
ncbi:MAG: glycosyltransferase [Ruminococcus sp.]|nr:glycosyltransferase [Ruminococcus sp.]